MTETLNLIKKEIKFPLTLAQNFFAVQNPIYGDLKSNKTKGGLEFASEASRKEYQEEIIMKSVKKLEKIEVVAVGVECKNVKKGDLVFIDPQKLMNPNVPRLQEGNKDEEIQFMIFREQDIIGIYGK